MTKTQGLVVRRVLPRRAAGGGSPEDLGVVQKRTVVLGQLDGAALERLVEEVEEGGDDGEFDAEVPAVGYDEERDPPDKAEPADELDFELDHAV